MPVDAQTFNLTAFNWSFSSVAYALGVISKNPLPDLEAMKIYPFDFFSEFYSFSSYISFFDSFSVNFYI